jgi:hypothetical protein
MRGQDWSLVVLHDHHLAGMMPTLLASLDRVSERGIAIVQEFPDSCIPIRRGQVRCPLEGLVAD